MEADLDLALHWVGRLAMLSHGGEKRTNLAGDSVMELSHLLNRLVDEVELYREAGDDEEDPDVIDISGYLDPEDVRVGEAFAPRPIEVTVRLG